MAKAKIDIGFCAACEQFTPNELIEQCKMAEKAGFAELLFSDHFQPWVLSQGQSGFVWSIMGAAGQVTTLPLRVGVTTPGFRYHPAIIAQAAATLASLFPGRFSLGLGIGEALNEHIVGAYWPQPHERIQMLTEAVTVINKLFCGGSVKHDGKYFKLETCCLYTLPDTPPPIFIGTAGPYLSRKAGEWGFGLLTPAASAEKLTKLADCHAAGLESKDAERAIQLHVSWATCRQIAVNNAITYWPNGGMNFPKDDIRSVELFERLAEDIQEENFKNRVLISDKAEDFIAILQKFADIGYDKVFVHNCGRNQKEFCAFFKKEVIPELKK